jgi:hypothetical protein
VVNINILMECETMQLSNVWMNLLLLSSEYEFQTTCHYPPQLYLEAEGNGFLKKVSLCPQDYTLSNPRKTVVWKHSKYTLGPIFSSSLAYFISERNYFIMCWVATQTGVCSLLNSFNLHSFCNKYFKLHIYIFTYQGKLHT